MLSNKIKYYLFLIVHLFICFCLVYGWIFQNKLWLEFLILASIYIQIMFGIFKGCICTRLERKYCSDKNTMNSVIDPIIKFLNIEKNKTNINFITGLFVNIGLFTTIVMRYIIIN